MTSQQKVLEVERQVRAMCSGEQEPIFDCPFCSQVSESGQFLCCPESAAVITAVLDHMEHIERTEVIEKTMERLSSISSMVGTVSLN